MESENAQQQIEDIEDLDQIDHLLECPNEDCPGDNESFTIIVEHEFKRKQDPESGNIENHWKGSTLNVIMCDTCRAVSIGDTIAQGLVDPEEDNVKEEE